MDLNHDLAFTLPLDMPPSAALDFVRDVPRSLGRADFLADLRVLAGDPPVVAASLPVDAALFGRHALPFRSQLGPIPDGARLTGLPLRPEGAGWAEVSGDARVVPRAGAAQVSYRFHIAVHLALPVTEHWGSRALLSMIRFSAASVLEGVLARLPEAIRAAAESVPAV